jgi:putative tryptophan/tyrosine transport system substrate-binding protein
MRRRDVIKAIAATSLSCPLIWPPAARAQQAGEKVRRIGVLTNLPENDPEDRQRMAAFLQVLQELGWREGGNLRIEYRRSFGKADNARKFAAELAALVPDVILATGSSSTGPLLEATRTVPIVFVFVPDPVGAGFVDSLARPGGNATGFSQFEYAVGGKWLGLLKEIAPRVARVGVLRDVAIAAGAAQFGVIQAAAAARQIELNPIGVRDADEIERGITAFASGSNGGLIVTGSPLPLLHRERIITMAARYRLPAVYFAPSFVREGGLISYGPDLVDQFRQAAGYVDRILRGAKPADLPVQGPTKYELAINLKAAKALRLTVPRTLQASADVVIE